MRSSWQPQFQQDGATSRRGRLCHTFFLAVLIALFWTPSTEAGGIRPWDSVLGLGSSLNDTLIYDYHSGLTKADPFPPADPIRVERTRAAAEKNGVNDTDLMDGKFPWGLVSQIQHGGKLYNSTMDRVFPHTCITQAEHGVFRESHLDFLVPRCSPFHWLILCQFYMYWFFSYRTKGRSFTDRRSFLLLMCGAVVLPVCAVQSDRILYTRLLGVSSTRASITWKCVSKLLVRTSRITGKLLRVSTSGTPFDAGGVGYMSGYAQMPNGNRLPFPWIPWDKIPRMGEATNPGPDFDFETLNIASAGKNQNTILEESATPAVKVFTETCLTKLVFETISKKAKGAKKFLLPGALCTPRQHMVKAASQTRGQSGGVLASSDLAARHSSVEMPTATWASTRVVDVVVALTSSLHIRVVGFYGITAKYHKNYVELNDNILSSVLSRILQSTLPCIIMGDFNCCLEDMPLWGRLSDWGWKDAAILNFERTGQEPMMTFKGETRIDYVLIPPQLVQFVKDFKVQPETVSDHALVSLRLYFPGEQLKTQTWKTCRDPEVLFRQCPVECGLDSECDHQVDQLIAQGQIDTAYGRFVKNYEKRIAKAYGQTDTLVPLASFCGRGRPKLIRKPLHCPLVRNPRNGEFQSTVDDAPLKFRQHIKQLRRVQTVVLQLRSFMRMRSESAKGAALETWCSALAAAGFPESFASFALDRWGIRIPGILEPQHLPIIELLFESMKTHQTAWEYQIAKLRRHKYKAYMDADWNKGGRAHALEVKPPPKPEISMLEVPYQMTITRLRHNKTGPFWITCHQTIPSGVQFVLQGEVKFHILEQKDRNLRLDKPLSGPTADCNILLLAPTIDLAQVTALTSEFWKKF